jgi:predicted amidohydrolase YtcJ
MPAPDVIITNARVHTVDRNRPTARAIAIHGERIAAVGSDEEVRPLAASWTRVIDAGGRLVIPGFNDAHVHLIRGAAELVGVDLRPSRDEVDLARRLAAAAATLPKGRWILGGYWDHESWPGRSLPTRAHIDAATPDHPVFVERLDGHMALANTAALRLAGLSDALAVPAGGAAVRDEAGRLTGILKDTAMDLVRRAIPPDGLEETLTKARAALAHAASLGVTTIQDMTVSALELVAYQRLRSAGQLTVRIYAMQNHDISPLVAAGIATGFGDDWLRIGGIKLFSDGSMGSGTAAFFEPYADDPSTCGLLIHAPEQLEQAVFDADAAGFQIIVHAIGDRANTLVLDVLERLIASGGARDRRPRIEHAQVVRPADKARFARLGVIASLQPSHCIDDMRWSARRIGEARSAIAYNIRSFAEAGCRIAFGTDWFVEPLNPMLGLYAAVTRQFTDGTPAAGWYPGERIGLSEAIEYYTLGSAYAEFAEDRKGSITPGKLADLVVLSRDLFSIPPREMLEARPVLTMAGGRVVFEDVWTN